MSHGMFFKSVNYFSVFVALIGTIFYVYQIADTIKLISQIADTIKVISIFCLKKIIVLS